MAGRSLSDKKIDEIKRLAGLGLSKRQIARALQIHRATVDRHINSQAGQDEPAISHPDWVGSVDWIYILSEIAKGVPAKILWEEMVERKLVSVTYQSFCRQLKKKIPQQVAATMKRRFQPGERAEIDYCDGIEIIDPITGEIQKTYLFVGCLCFSRFTFAEFSLSQKSIDFLSSHRRMFEYFKGVPQVISPDNLKSAVTKTHRYDPEINQAYQRLAQHYKCAVVPARVRRPKDKAIVERTIQSFQRWFFYKVRHQTFTSIVEINQCLSQYLELFNDKTHRIFRKSRREMLMAEQSRLRPLPATPFEVQTHHVATLHPDCHLSFDKNYYSAPHHLRGFKLDVWASQTTVEIYHLGERVAFHTRWHNSGQYKTDKNHYPEGHQAYWDSTAKKLRSSAAKLGPHISKLIHQQLSGPYPLRFVRRCQGTLRLAKKYNAKSLDAACETALMFERYHVSFIERLIKTSAQKQSTQKVITRGSNPFLRGGDYFS